MPKTRAKTLITVAEAYAGGLLRLDPGADREHERAQLLTIPGIGPWTADYVKMRAHHEPDVLLVGDLGVRDSAKAHSFDLNKSRTDLAPWRSYVTNHLWATSHEATSVCTDANSVPEPNINAQAVPRPETHRNAPRSRAAMHSARAAHNCEPMAIALDVALEHVRTYATGNDDLTPSSEDHAAQGKLGETK